MVLNDNLNVQLCTVERKINGCSKVGTLERKAISKIGEVNVRENGIIADRTANISKRWVMAILIDHIISQRPREIVLGYLIKMYLIQTFELRKVIYKSLR